MTENAKSAVLMRVGGKTYQEIGDALGISRQGAFQLVRNAIDDRPDTRKGRKIKYAAYPNITRVMQEKRVTQRQLADSVGLSYTHLNRILVGKSGTTVEVMRKISKVLGMTMDEASEKAAPND